jgi:hypothetical protein
MKKFTYSAILILIIGGLGYYQFTHKYAKPVANKLEESAVAYLDEVLPRIIAHWSKEELMKQASPRLLEHLKLQPKFFIELGKLNKLGKLRSYRGAEGYVRTIETINSGRTTLGYYKAFADYEKASVSLTVKLIWVDNSWRILVFNAWTPFPFK